MSDKVRLIYSKIENRIDEICDDGFVLKENQQEYETLTDLEDFIDSLPKESGCEVNCTTKNEDLEEYAKKLAKGAALDKHNLIWMCKKGAEWQKQQMMKNAVEAFVNTYENTDDGNYVEFVTEQSPCKFKELEKCKLIIIKKEQ